MELELSSPILFLRFFAKQNKCKEWKKNKKTIQKSPKKQELSLIAFSALRVLTFMQLTPPPHIAVFAPYPAPADCLSERHVTCILVSINSRPIQTCYLFTSFFLHFFFFGRQWLWMGR